MCFPHFDSPTVFAAMLDGGKGGSFSITPAVDGVRQKQMYLPDTNVLITRSLSQGGVSELTDFMPTNQPHHTHAVVRRVTCVKGPLRAALRLRESDASRTSRDTAGSTVRLGRT